MSDYLDKRADREQRVRVFDKVLGAYIDATRRFGGPRNARESYHAEDVQVFLAFDELEAVLVILCAALQREGLFP